MSQIITNGNLAAGSLRSDPVEPADNLRISVEVTGIMDEQAEIKVFPKVKGENSTYRPITGEEDRGIIFRFRGNRAFTKNLQGLNAASFVIDVKCPVGLVGTINVWSESL